MAASLGCFFVIELIMKTIVVVLKHVFKAIFKYLLSAYISIASCEDTENRTLSDLLGVRGVCQGGVHIQNDFISNVKLTIIKDVTYIILP